MRINSVQTDAGTQEPAYSGRRKRMRIKGFDKNLCCRGFQFEVGGEYKIERNGEPLRLCSNTVFHYGSSLRGVHSYYSAMNENNRFCEIEVLGEEITDGEKYGSDHIKILREITGEELEILKDRVDGNTGVFNTGSYNTGNYNTGNGNTGNYNTGNCNTGNWNTGDCNTGDCNITDHNAGCFCTENHKILFLIRNLTSPIWIGLIPVQECC